MHTPAMVSRGQAVDPPAFVRLAAHPLRWRLMSELAASDYRVRELEGDEKGRWWARAVEVWPDYDNYQAGTERVIPAFLLEPADR